MNPDAVEEIILPQIADAAANEAEAAWQLFSDAVNRCMKPCRYLKQSLSPEVAKPKMAIT